MACKRYGLLFVHSYHAGNPQWIVSRHLFHIMRDHIDHDGKVLAGMFGGVKGCLGDARMEDLIKDYVFNPDNDPNDFWSDQKFLTEVIFLRSDIVS